ncbi:hypothetical protein [Adhaeretor mobilis]|uniref:DUF4440 domain-containing protein n=1 Tax=Adhaeretor mobilis TaxID=1930276 RepID=A0A517MZ89_9BACT|nr:hypothetical protein [Adhaeretor mobilis]QDT00128.1 hypothetical protein HG15A2_34630 [Adhaeretor mobilis]
MSLLLENPVAIGAIGAVAATFAGLVFLSRRSGKSAVVLALVLIATSALLTVERLVVTDREQIETALHDTMAAIAENDLQAVLDHINPQTSTVLADAKSALPLVQVNSAGASNIETKIVEGTQPLIASTYFRGMLNGTTKKRGVRIGYFDDVLVVWTKIGDRWLIESYMIYQNGIPINATARIQSLK